MIAPLLLGVCLGWVARWLLAELRRDEELHQALDESIEKNYRLAESMRDHAGPFGNAVVYAASFEDGSVVVGWTTGSIDAERRALGAADAWALEICNEAVAKARAEFWAAKDRVPGAPRIGGGDEA